MHAEPLTKNLMIKLFEEAAASSRKRAIYTLHEEGAELNEMVNAFYKGTYVMPHMHPNGRAETFMILRGEVAVPIFTEDGTLIRPYYLNENGPVKVLRIMPGTWHGLVVLSDKAAIYEVLLGKYDKNNPENSKRLCSWAPAEGSPDSQWYLNKLMNEILETKKMPHFTSK